VDLITKQIGQPADAAHPLDQVGRHCQNWRRALRRSREGAGIQAAWGSHWTGVDGGFGLFGFLMPHRA